MRHPTTPAPQTAGYVIHGARSYDFFNRLFPFVRALHRELVALAAPSPGEHALDVGCGTGTLVIELRAHVGSGVVRGIDASPEMIAVATAKAARAGAEVEFQVALVEALPFADASFDLVTSSLMLHHLPADIQREGLAEIRRVLKPGGRFVVVDFAARNHSPVRQLLAALGRADVESTAAGLVPMLEEVGFGEVEAVSTRHKRFVFIRAR